MRKKNVISRMKYWYSFWQWYVYRPMLQIIIWVETYYLHKPSVFVSMTAPHYSPPVKWSGQKSEWSSRSHSYSISCMTTTWRSLCDHVCPSALNEDEVIGGGGEQGNKEDSSSNFPTHKNYWRQQLLKTVNVTIAIYQLSITSTMRVCIWRGMATYPI